MIQLIIYTITLSQTYFKEEEIGSKKILFDPNVDADNFTLSLSMSTSLSDFNITINNKSGIVPDNLSKTKKSTSKTFKHLNNLTHQISSEKMLDNQITSSLKINMIILGSGIVLVVVGLIIGITRHTLRKGYEIIDSKYLSGTHMQSKAI
jgi:hypothetical protein